MSDLMTEDQFKQALPPALRKNVGVEVMDKVNALLADPDMAEVYRENLLSYSQVMKEGKFKLTGYVDAVKYVSQKLMNKTNLAAFSATFPGKMVEWNNRGVSGKDISSYISAYAKSKLVMTLMEQTIMPSWVLNQDLYQEALNVQAELMRSAKSEKVKSDAANSVLTQLRRPDTHKIELDVGVKEDSAVAALRDMTHAYVKAQREALQAGAINAEQAAHEKLVFDHDSGELDDDA